MEDGDIFNATMRSPMIMMKPVDIDRFFSPQEKKLTETQINVFYDKNRKLKRHADGLTLIKQIVQPIATHQRIRRLPKEQKELIELAI